jgi:hypothetical protein
MTLKAVICPNCGGQLDVPDDRGSGKCLYCGSEFHLSEAYKHKHEHGCHGPGAYQRRRGTAIVDTPQGIIVVQQGHAKFLLPGGGARHGESRLQAAIRELREETGLFAENTQFLFQHQCSKVFLVKSNGIPKADNEISHIEYYKKDSTIQLSFNTKLIIERYWNMIKANEI